MSGFKKAPTIPANNRNTNNKQKFKIMENRTKNIFKGVLVAGAIITGSAFSVNASNALSFNKLGSGSEIRANLLNSTDYAFNTFEAKCGEGKCGETKKTTEATKAKTTKTTTEAKSKEAKCGEGKCGEAKKAKNDSTQKANAAKAKAESKAKEAKCGEGKCGEE